MWRPVELASSRAAEVGGCGVGRAGDRVLREREREREKREKGERAHVHRNTQQTTHRHREPNFFSLSSLKKKNMYTYYFM